MAKAKKKAAGKMADRLPNRTYIVVSIPAATTTLARSTVDTLMGARERAGWLISRVDVQPKGLMDGWPTTAMGIRFQVVAGTPTGTFMLAADDPTQVCTIDVQTAVLTSGMNLIQFPISWVGPVLIASKKITFLPSMSRD